MTEQVSFVSFNVRGLRDNKKRRAIFRHMHVKYSNHVVVLQETHSTEDIEKRWIAEWGGNIIFSHGSGSARGTCIMIPRQYRGEIIEHKRDQEGRIVSVLLNIKNTNISLVGLYAPTQGNCQMQVNFYAELREHVRALHAAHPVVVCGDFNVHLLALDTSQTSFKPSAAADAVSELAREFDLRDVWREINPNLRRYTWRKCHPLQQSRIDYFLVSSTIIDAHEIEKIDIEPGPRSDHSIITMSVKIFSNKRGPGVWRLNLSLLENTDVVQEIKEEIDRAKKRQKQYSDADEPGLLLEMLLSNIRVTCIRASKRIARDRRRRERELEEGVKELESSLAQQSPSLEVRDDYQKKKDELDAVKLQAAETAMLWSRAKWLEYGEKPTKYFLSLQKKKNADKDIHAIEDTDGRIVTGNKEILDYCRSFFELLHQSKGVPENVDDFMQNVEVPKLSEHDRLLCEGPLTLEECRNAVSSMSDNKSPSVSGFNKEFMKFFWNDIGELIVTYINEAYRTGRLFITQRRGILVLIPKTGNQKILKNKRPICLLDIVYKIIAKVLATRLSAVIKEVIHSNQTAFLKGRNIQDNLRIIHDVINYTKTDNTSGILVALDFKAAFNSIEHHFIWYALQCFGFGDSFIRWVRLLYNGTMLSVLNNGYTSEWFEPKRGIMQGCPISGMLFNLAVELLAVKIRHLDAIGGITINNVEIKLSQYADDATVFVKDVKSVEVLVEQLKIFGEMSGLELNVGKSKLMWLGKERHKTESVCGIPSSERVKILGMWFSSTECCVSQNLNPVINQIQNTINMWSQRDLSIKGRITVSKSLLISKLVYIISCVSVPETKLKSIQSLIMKYVWRGRPPKVKNKVICQSIADGGLGAADVQAMYISLKISWIRRLLIASATWAQVFKARCHPYAVEDLLRSRYDRKDLERLRLAEFYVGMLLEYRKLQEPVPCTSVQMLRETVWFNSNITVNKRTVFDERMYNCGIKYVGDLVDGRGKMLTYEKFNREYPACNIGFLKYAGIISAVPRMWKETIRSAGTGMRTEDRDKELYIKCRDKEISLKVIKTKQIYLMVNKISIVPTAFERWSNEGLGQLNWSEVMLTPYNCTKSTKLQTFQYQIIHRFIPTNKFLHVRGLKVSADCQRCGNIDTCIHYFFACQTVRRFWNEVFQFINRNTRPRRHTLSIGSVMFGIPDAPSVVNLLILLAKHYLHMCAGDGREPRMEPYIGYVKNVYATEMKAAKDCVKNIEKTEIKWKEFALELAG